MSNHKRGTATRIYNKFEHWSVEDCDCTLCEHYEMKGKLCRLEKCCIADIKEEAIRREAEAQQAQAIIT